MTDELPIMVAAVVVAVGVMFAAAGPVTRFVNENPSVVMLALAFLLMIGMVSHRGRVRAPRAEGLHLFGDGLRGRSRGSENARPAPPRADRARSV